MLRITVTIQSGGDLTDNEYRRAANLTVIIAGLTALLWLFFKYILDAVLPFLAAIPIAALISPISKRLSQKVKISKTLTAACLVILFFSAFSLLCYYAGARLISEVGNLLERLSENPESISSALERLASGFGAKFGFLRKIFESEGFRKLGLDLDRLLPEALSALMTSLSARLPSAAAGMVSKIPSALLSTAVFLISCFYFAVDGERFGRYFASALPDRWQSRLPEIKRRISQTTVGYLKAYLLIMLITFFEVFIGLTILGVNYALLISLIVSVVDILPILGTGTVLIPWSVVSFAMGDAYLGTGLLILYGVVLILRQLIEPKIVGNSIGLHPLVTLAAVYLGVRFTGLIGIFIGPMVALCVKGFGNASTD